jgi:hypothetical protein
MKQNIFTELGSMGVFRDKNNLDDYYTMPIESANLKRDLELEFKGKAIPDSCTIKVYPIFKSGEDDNSIYYKPDTTKLVEFSINRIDGLWLKMK